MTLIGVELPEGARKIELRFASAPYEKGKKMTQIALLLAALWWGAALIVGKVRRA